MQTGPLRDAHDNRPTITRAQLHRLIAAHVERAGGIRPLAREWGISPGHVHDLTAARIDPSPTILAKLGVVKRVRVTYLLEDPETTLPMLRRTP